MATTTNFGWETPDDTDLVKDGALAMRTLGNAIDASLVDLKGGTTGQVLSKTSNTDMDFTWVTSDDANAIQNTIVDAKGDLITATGSDVPARLAVGSNGDTLVADSAATTGLRWQGNVSPLNPVINGAFDVWQRGTSITIGSTASGTYTADRWAGYGGGSGAFVVSRQTTSDTTNLPFIQYCARVQRSAGQTTTDFLQLSNMFETVNTIPYVGKTVTLSFYARAGANFSPTSSNMISVIRYGTGTDQNVYSGYTAQVADSQNNTLTTTWQRFKHTYTIPTTATELSVQFQMVGVGTAGANDYFEVTGVQLDVGNVPLPFRRAGGTLQGEISLCQRYYVRLGNEDAYQRYAMGTAVSTTAAEFTFTVPVLMRTDVPVLEYSNLAMYDGVTVKTFTNLARTADGSYATLLYATGASGLTQYRPYELINNNNASGYIAYSAEL